MLLFQLFLACPTLFYPGLVVMCGYLYSGFEFLFLMSHIGWPMIVNLKKYVITNYLRQNSGKQAYDMFI